MQQAVIKQYSGPAGFTRSLPRMASVVGVVGSIALAFGALGWFALSTAAIHCLLTRFKPKGQQ